MGWKDLLSVAALTALKPVVVAIIAIVGIILLIIPVLIVWTYGLMTGLVFGLVTLLFVFVLHRWKMIDVKEHSWLILIPFVSFFAGYVVEHCRVFPFQIYPLTTLMSTTASTAFDITLTSTLTFIIVICLVIGLVAERVS